MKESNDFYGTPRDDSSELLQESGEIEVVNPETTVESDEKGFIPSTPDELAVDFESVEAPTPPRRVGRAVQVNNDVVENILLVALDDNDQPVGFEVPYGTELVVVEDDSPVSIGWVRVDNDFVSPE